MNTREEDDGILKYSGLMGHPITVIVGEPGSRRKCCEVNSVDEAKRYSQGQAHAIAKAKGGAA